MTAGSVGSAQLRAALPACQTAMVRCSCCEHHPVRSASHHGCSRGPRAASCDTLSRCMFATPQQGVTVAGHHREEIRPPCAPNAATVARGSSAPAGQEKAGPVAQAPTPFSPSASNTRCELIAAVEEGGGAQRCRVWQREGRHLALAAATGADVRGGDWGWLRVLGAE